MTDSPAALETLRSRVGHHPVALARLAQLLVTKGQAERARKLCAQAVAMAPGSAEVRALAAEVFSHEMPTYYFSMIEDTDRYKVYELAFRSAIRSSSSV